ncbi:hypothetical protein [Parasphingorhabdus sp.]|uniref:hypothetical protein n=1 Tax=Parasphingorhabdus sp. TaxID=2709688 RepID=UPI002B2778D8|nr:hypothetical protein [Parasphingorhabdus sp.]
MFQASRILILFAFLSASATAAPPGVGGPVLRQHEGETVPTPVMLKAKTLTVYDAAEADQGAAADERHFYAIDNSAIGKYLLADGSAVAQWSDLPSPGIEHLNSCYVEAAQLWCANSNYPAAPMGSSIEVFDTKTMEHHATHSLGMMEEGSLTWFAATEGGFLASFAHYDQRGVPYKDHRYSSVVIFDKQWRRTGGWLFPKVITDLMAPYAASGGAIGPDGRLYVSGHDRPEIYVLEAPISGPYLTHVATISLEIEGQAFAFGPANSQIIYAVDRKLGLVKAIELPKIP